MNETPLYFEPEADRPHDTPLLYPGKVVADPEGKRLFIADTDHNRIVVTDLDGKHLETAGDGAAAHKDGGFAESSFDRPQGVRLFGPTSLLVADTENHVI